MIFLLIEEPRKLFTPGPLETTETVKRAMLRDMGAGDIEFRSKVEWCKSKLLEIANVSSPEDNYVSVIMQGTGTYGVESVIQCTSSAGASHFLILENGTYGKRVALICQHLNIRHHVESFEENRAISIARLEKFLENNKLKFTHVGLIHSETSSGALNDVTAIGHLVKKYFPNAIFIVDSMCCFGAIEVNVKESQIDFLIASSNKCIQSVPGISFVIANREKLGSHSQSLSLSLDLFEQNQFFDKCKLFRFTPPTHVLLAFEQALKELDEEGGPVQRYNRIKRNHALVRDEMLKMGFREFVPLDEQSRIINSFYHPREAHFTFEKFHYLLREKGMLIYSKSLTTEPTFRIGNIGNLFEKDMIDLMKAIREVLHHMNINVPLN